ANDNSLTSLAEMMDGKTGEMGRRHQVDLQGFIPMGVPLLSRCVEPDRRADGRVVDQYVNPSLPGYALLPQLLELAPIGQICPEWQATFAPNLCGDGLGPVAAAGVVQHYIGVFSGEGAHRTLADAPRPTGHQNGLTRQINETAHV